MSAASRRRLGMTTISSARILLENKCFMGAFARVVPRAIGRGRSRPEAIKGGALWRRRRKGGRVACRHQHRPLTGKSHARRYKGGTTIAPARQPDDVAGEEVAQLVG